MTQEQAQQVLDELDGVRPEMLTGEAKKLFEAIMTIADNRDELKKKVQEQNKIIDLMSEQLTTPVHSREWVKIYYENKVKERDTNENTKNNK